MTYEQIWNTVEDLYEQNLLLAKEANNFFGITNLADEITTQDGLVIKMKRRVSQENKRREGVYEVSFNSPTKMINFRIGRTDGHSRESHGYILDIPGIGNAIGEGTMVLDEPDDMKNFIKYVRDWKLKNLLD